MTTGWAAPGGTGPDHDRSAQHGPGDGSGTGGAAAGTIPPNLPPRRELETDPGLFPLRPMSLGELLGAAFRIYRARPRLVLGISAIVMAIAFVLSTSLTGVSMLPSMLQMGSLDDAATTEPELFSSVREAVMSVLGQLGSSLITMVAASAVTIAVTIITVTEAVRMPLRGAQVRTVMKRRLLPAVVASLLVGIITVVIWVLALALGLLPLIILQELHWWMLLPPILTALLAILASVWVYGHTVLVIPSVTIERLGPIAALRRSFSLTRGRRLWRVLGTSLLLALIQYFATQFLAGALSTVGMIVYFAILLATGGEAFAAAMVVLLVSTMFAAFVSSALLAPFSACGHAALYTDTRMRHEAWDVTLTAAARDGSHADEFTVR